MKKGKVVDKPACDEYIIEAIRELRAKRKGTPPGLRASYLYKNVVHEAGYTAETFDHSLRYLLDEGMIMIVSTVVRTGSRSCAPFVAELLSNDIPTSYDFRPIFLDYDRRFAGEMTDKRAEKRDVVRIGGPHCRVYVVEDGLPKIAKEADGIGLMDGPSSNRVHRIMSRVSGN